MLLIFSLRSCLFFHRYDITILIQYETPFSPFQVAEYKEALDWLTVNQFDGAELCISSYDHIDTAQIHEELKARGLGCSTISTGQARAIENISLLHEGEALDRCRKRILQHIDAAAVLESRVTLGLIRGLGTPGNEKQDRETLAKNMDGIIDYAEKKKVTLLLESINRYETTLCTGAEATMSFIRQDLGNPACIGVLWDIFHANIEDAHFLDAIDCMGDKLLHVHMADSNRMLPGYGHIDFDTIVKKLKEQHFSGYLSYECLNLPTLEIVKNESGKFIQRLRGL